MAEETTKIKDDGNEYCVLVPRVGKAVQNLQILVSQRMAKVENGHQIEPPKTDILTPNGQGLFVLPKEHPEHKLRLKAIELFKKNNNISGKAPVLIGPFETQEEAFNEMDRVRPKTDAEQAGRAAAKLKDAEAEKEKLACENKAMADELAALREKIGKATGNSK